MASAIIGHDVETGKPVVIEDEDRQRGLYIIGTTGTGKTTLLESLALQDMQNGLGVCVLDPHGDLISRLLAQLPLDREEDVVLLDPRDAAFPFGLNPYWCEDPDDAELVGRQAAQVSELFEKLWGSEGSEGTSWGPRVAQFIRNTAFTLLANRGLTMAEIPALLSNAEFRARVVRNVGNTQVRLFWENYDRLRTPERQLERADSTLNKLDEFLTQPIVANIVGQSEPTVNFRKFMDERKIVLVPLGLGRLGDPVVSLLGSLMTLQILNAALSRENATVRPQFNLYADEYQRFATPAFATLLTEARKYGLATTIAHQTRSQLDATTRAAALNAGNLIVFGVHGEDAEELAKQFDRTPPEPETAGRRQKQSVSQNPPALLARNGHQDPVIRQMVNTWLGDLVSNVSNLPENGRLWSRKPEPAWEELFLDEGGYYASKATLATGQRMLDTYLVDWMEDRIDWGTIRDRLLALLLQLRAFFCLAPDEVPTFTGRYRKYERPSSSLSVIRMAWEPRLGQDALRSLILKRLTSVSDSVGAAARFGSYRTVYWQAILEATMGLSEDSPENTERASKRGLTEALHANNILADLVMLGRRLHEQPILVDSGQWETVQDRPRPYADVREQIANELVKQAQFHAVCRISREGESHEYRIRTPSFTILDESHSFTGVDAIRERSRRLYGLPRKNVEAAFRKRLEEPPGDGHSRIVDLGGDDE